MTGALTHVETWIFDLDNTLYPVTKTLLADIDRHIGSFVADFLGVERDEARRIQKAYFRTYWLTLKGLMVEHGLDPARYFLVDSARPLQARPGFRRQAPSESGENAE